jgi:hypothetical protein
MPALAHIDPRWLFVAAATLVYAALVLLKIVPVSRDNIRGLSPDQIQSEWSNFLPLFFAGAVAIVIALFFFHPK